MPGEVEILAGVAAGETVVTHGIDKARDGQSVRIRAVDDGSRAVREMFGGELTDDAASHSQP
jgi:membrane fusion protein (multidrug efflux system)